VDGVLKHSLYNGVLVSVGKREVKYAVEAPWKYNVWASDTTNSPLDYQDVSAIYDKSGLLLILGEPGSGKTTALLDLTRTLLERAEKDTTERVPVVLKLSSWNKKQKKRQLGEWILDELLEKYRVEKKIARSWLEENYLLVFLDGLDEVEPSVNSDCVNAINEFVEKFNPSGLVVCCRFSEYRLYPSRLKLNRAIRLEPLTKDDLTKYFAKCEPELAALREAVKTDPVLQQLVATPLVLRMMSRLFQGVRGDALVSQKAESLDERRKQIFQLYVDQMTQRIGTICEFPTEKTIAWLAWLAARMREHSQSRFYPGGLYSNWFGSRAKRVAYRTVVGLCSGLVFGALFGLIGGLSVGLGRGLGGAEAGWMFHRDDRLSERWANCRVDRPTEGLVERRV
jgi:energy-coupling factor transporter ATP-binding protein EcfA2